MLSFTSIGLVSALFLFLLLVQKEVLAPATSEKAAVLRRILNISVLPVVIVVAISIVINLEMFVTK